jgi:hypothetical protein
MDAQSQSQPDSRDTGVYLLLIRGESGDLSYSTYESKKDVVAAIEKLGASKLSSVKLFKSAKEVEIKTKVTFTF